MKVTHSHIVYSIGVFMLLVLSFGFTTSPKELQHTILVNHPGIEGDEPLEYSLTEELSDNGETIHFSLIVESVICTDSQCKVVPVKIYWDNLGDFKRIELQDNVYLEKYKGEEFSELEYLKLDSILRNKNSVLANFKIEEISVHKQPNENTNPDVDGITGATNEAIPETETVKGATLTCYTLWHWVNGDVVQEIQEISTPKLSRQNLITLLESNSQKQLIALNELTKRQLFEEEVIESIIQTIPKSNALFTLKALTYLNKLPETEYFKVLSNHINQKDDAIRMAMLNSLDQTTFDIPEKIATSICIEICSAQRYEEINYLLDIFEEKEINYSSTNKAVLSLLDSDDFSAAYRGYLFLEDKNLAKKPSKRLKQFYTQNKEEIENAGKNTNPWVF